MIGLSGCCGRTTGRVQHALGGAGTDFLALVLMSVEFIIVLVGGATRERARRWWSPSVME